jgi:hypothetical protein
VVRGKQRDRAKAGRFLDFPGQNTPDKLVENKLHFEKPRIVDGQQVDGVI